MILDFKSILEEHLEKLLAAQKEIKAIDRESLNFSNKSNHHCSSNTIHWAIEYTKQHIQNYKEHKALMIELAKPVPPMSTAERCGRKRRFVIVVVENVLFVGHD